MQMNKRLSRETISVAVLCIGTIALLASIGALNGGTALTASVWDSLVTEAKTWLASTYTLTFATLLLVIAVWQAGHGKGYGLLGGVLGVLVIALIGPTVVSSIAKSTRPTPSSVAQVQQVEQTTSTPSVKNDRITQTQ